MAGPTPQDLEQVLIDAVDTEADSERIERDDWAQIRTPSSPRANHNQILRARLGPADVDPAIETVAADHRARGAAYRWVVGPSSAPPGLTARLRATGHRHIGDAFGMIWSTADRPDVPTISGLTIDPMRPETVALYAELTTRAWERDEQFAEAVLYIARKALTPARGLLPFIASVDDQPVATSLMRILPGLGYMQGCAVLPSHRRRGLYKALVEHRIAQLRARAIETAVIWADTKGSGLACRTLGFRTLCTAAFFESPDAA